MDYAKDFTPDSNYRSVNTLIQPKKYSGVSVFPPSATQTKKKQALEPGAPLTATLPQEGIQTAQAKFTENSTEAGTIQPKENQTGLPDHLKAGIEDLSGLSLDDARVHYDSSKPGEIGSLAYTQGRQIHVAPGQERHLPHEAWHVVQQMQGRVWPTIQGKGTRINDDPGLEHEADRMGALAGLNTAPLSTQTGIPERWPMGAEVMQRMADPDQKIQDTLRAVHVKLYKRYKALSSIPTPSAMKPKIQRIIKDAETVEDAHVEYARYVVDTYFIGAESFLKERKKEVGEMITSAISVVDKTQKKRKQELEDLQKLEEDELPAKKRQRGSKEPKIKEYSEEERTLLAQKLKDPVMQRKLYRASFRGYLAHRAKSRPAVKDLARLNALPKIQPLSTSDMAMAQVSYQQESTGDALLLEEGEKYQVTMSRRGGQEIHQLGPYLPGGRKKSIQEIIQEILKNTKLNSQELAEAINIKNPAELQKFLESKDVSDDYFEKIRAMRQLIAVEKARGPETAFATSLEHRSAVHGYRHMEEYPEKTPLGPTKATTALREAREKRLKEEGTTDEMPSDFGYIPIETQERAMESTTHFLTKFVEKPALDPEAGKLAEVILLESEKGEPSEGLVEAMEEIVHTPIYTGGFGEDE